MMTQNVQNECCQLNVTVFLHIQSFLPALPNEVYAKRPRRHLYYCRNWNSKSSLNSRPQNSNFRQFFSKNPENERM